MAFYIPTPDSKSAKCLSVFISKYAHNSCPYFSEYICLKFNLAFYNCIQISVVKHFFIQQFKVLEVLF